MGIVDTDPWLIAESGGGSLTSPVRRMATVTPNDTNELAFLPRYVWCGTGNASSILQIVDIAGTTLNLTGLAVGVWHALRPVKINATGTTFTNIRIGA